MLDCVQKNRMKRILIVFCEFLGTLLKAGDYNKLKGPISTYISRTDPLEEKQGRLPPNKLGP